MNLKSILRSNVVRVMLMLLVFALIVYVGSILFACGLGFQKRTAFLRALYMVIAVAWVVFTVRWLCLKYNFAGLWRGMMNDVYSHQEDFVLRIHREYQLLLSVELLRVLVKQLKASLLLRNQIYRRLMKLQKDWLIQQTKINTHLKKNIHSKVSSLEC